MNYLIIDIGSNTVKYDLFSCSDDGPAIKLGHRSTALRLINHIHDGRLSKEGLALLCGTLEEYKADARKADAQVFPFATASLRRIKEPFAVIDAVKESTGLEIVLLSGDEEAECSFLGMCATLKALPKTAFMADMGGGSTELNLFEEGKSLYLYSCPFGALSVKNAAGVSDAMTAKERQAAEDYVRALLPQRLSAFGEGGKTAVLVGGTGKACRTLAKELLKIKKADALTREEFSALLDLVTDPKKKHFEKMKKLVPQRYQLMGAGLAAFDAIFKEAGVERILICPGGIRDGYLTKLRQKNAPKE